MQQFLSYIKEISRTILLLLLVLILYYMYIYTVYIILSLFYL